MSERALAAFLRTLRRAASYAQLYGADHALTEEASGEAASAGTMLVGKAAGVLIAVVDDTVFLDGAPCGTTSLQYNGFVRSLEGANVESLILTGRLATDDVTNLVKLINGDIDEFTDGTTIRVNDVEVASDHPLDTPGAELRRSYSGALDTLRMVGTALHDQTPLKLDETVTAVQKLLAQGLQSPQASMLLATVKSHHEYTFYHSINTSILSLAVARLVGLPEREQLLLGVGAMLHDIGKIGISTAILTHPGRLDDHQWAEIRRHPQVGAEAILAAAAPGQEVAAAVAFEHHARFDGSGYPRLVYHDGTHHHHDHPNEHAHPLHFFSRLVAVADTYDAITTRRSYRRAEPPSRALQILVNEAGTSYDPDFVTAFVHLMGIHPPGSFLRLRGGAVVMVTEPSPDPNRAPSAVLVRDGTGFDLPAPEPIPFGLDDVVEHVPAAILGVSAAEVMERTAA